MPRPRRAGQSRGRPGCSGGSGGRSRGPPAHRRLNTARPVRRGTSTPCTGGFPIWFNGVTGRDITDDHVDATSRFLAAGDGLVQMPLATDTDAWSKDARQQYQILSTSTDADGTPIAVTELQGPDYSRIRSSDFNFVAAYANYYVCNGAVISAQFGDTRADAGAKAALQRLFPGRTVEQLDTDSLGAGGGGIHCVTQQQPRP
ncbi:agmatine deiminase family protein [Streptomyces sp. NPDC005507]|uniref:agmatine deiminase family protein n=1 Tax=Streptomyces sp. NPDC005507 TaxID=3154885 RepID=UPI0033B8AB4E